jgi:hypothetical protein
LPISGQLAGSAAYFGSDIAVIVVELGLDPAFAGVTVATQVPEAASLGSVALGLDPRLRGGDGWGGGAPDEAAFDSVASNSSQAEITAGRRYPCAFS